MTHVVAQWETLHASHPAWRESRRLYALSFGGTVLPLLYIGIALKGGSSVHDRVRTHTDRFAEDLHRARVDRFHVISAKLDIVDGGRSSQLLFRHVENLLTREIRPTLNSQNRQRYTGRAQLRVECRGAWPGDIACLFSAPGWVDPPPPVRCARCSTSNNRVFRYCSECGEPLNQST